MRALLIDLDETLYVEEPAAVAAFAATAQAASTQDERLDAARLALDARARARELWRRSPLHPYCSRIGISSWEGMWCRFAGEVKEMRALRAWSGEYRRGAWSAALADQGVHDDSLVGQLASRFGVERRTRHAVFAEAPEVLAALHGPWMVAIVTNGAPCLQREKLAASGLQAHVDAVVVAGDADVGAGKPDGAIFRRALAALGLPSGGEAVMVGDSLARDVDGATAAGLRAVWVNRAHDPLPEGREPVAQVADLRELIGLLDELVPA